MDGAGAATARFPIRHGDVYARLARTLFLPPSSAWIEVGRDEVEARMGWAFRARFPRSAVRWAAPLGDGRLVVSRGVHGFAGRWLVNGAGDRILRVELAPTQRAWVAGFPVKLRELLVSLDDPAAVAAALLGPRASLDGRQGRPGR